MWDLQSLLWHVGSLVELGLGLVAACKVSVEASEIRFPDQRSDWDPCLGSVES